MHILSNYQPRPQAMSRNSDQRCQSCKEQRSNLQQAIWVPCSAATFTVGFFSGQICNCSVACSSLTGASCIGCFTLCCWNNIGRSIDRCLTERKCCHFDNLPYQPDSGEINSSGASETDARKKLSGDRHSTTPFQMITVQPGTNSVRNRAAPGILISPDHSLIQENDNNDVPADSDKKTKADFVAVDILEDFLIGYGTQARK